MPELPEVETVRRGLTNLVQNAVIKNVEVRYTKMVSPESPLFEQAIEGKTIEKKLIGVANICYFD